MDLKIIYENNDILVVDKPAGIVVFPEGQTKEGTIIDLLVEKYPDLKNTGQPPRYGIVHRLDKDTSGILLTAKNNEALFFLQKQFKTKGIEKKYITLVVGNIENDTGIIETLIGRSPKDRRKQKVYLIGEPNSEGKREAITEYKVIERFPGYTLIEVNPKTGRKHQIRCHLSYLQHPIAGDKMYGFKGQPTPKGLNHHFLHANYIKIKLPNGQEKEFHSNLAEELNKIIKDLRKQ